MTNNIINYNLIVENYNENLKMKIYSTIINQQIKVLFSH